MIEVEHSLSPVIPVLVTGIQCTQVIECKRLFRAADVALLDYLQVPQQIRGGNEGGWICT